ncbi:MAG: MotA/TolQ/ExbB proton channel family protein [Phycisphaerales bacterium]|jgi:biopolymer transport protein ExbB|nr:MotA/TolQ/ExbB proton channel family protein [Phycisphaerales bacterium]
MGSTWELLVQVFRDGGAVMFVLLGVSIVASTLCAERAMFWLATSGGGAARRWRALTARVRAGDRPGAIALARAERSFAQRFAAEFMARVSDVRDGAAIVAIGDELVEEARPALERFSSTLSAVITAAPMLGILGTVLGIIESFQLLGSSGPVTDPTAVAGGIAKALYTTVFGLVVALLALLPFVAFRAMADRATGRLESLVALVAACWSDGKDAGVKSPD